MRSAVAIAVLAAALALAGCVTESERARPIQPPWPEDGAPDILRALAEDLSACQAATGRMPDNLAALDRSGLATAGPYGARGFAYHPTGIGILHDGWRLIAADDRMRTAQHVWCVIRAPVRINGSPALRTVLVPMIELRAAAAAAGGG